ncbi:MAG: hypothetical protein O2783_00725 [Chloroflexi bacterium]|nr:hypothetical protein [Chloroflexota bacterium]
MYQRGEENDQSSGEPQSSGGSGFSFRAWWKAQKAATTRDIQRLQSWWREHTTPVEEPPQSNARESSSNVSTGWFGNTARIAIWAPIAVILALVEAAFITAISFVVLSRFVDYSVTADRMITAGTAFVVFCLLLFWFASVPNVPTTTRRFRALFQAEVVILGVIGLAIAISVTLEKIDVI